MHENLGSTAAVVGTRSQNRTLHLCQNFWQGFWGFEALRGMMRVSMMVIIVETVTEVEMT